MTGPLPLFALCIVLAAGCIGSSVETRATADAMADDVSEASDAVNALDADVQRLCVSPPADLMPLCEAAHSAWDAARLASQAAAVAVSGYRNGVLAFEKAQALVDSAETAAQDVERAIEAVKAAGIKP